MKQRPDQSIIQEVALATDIAEAFVEKDWFVTQAIRAVAEIKHSGCDLLPYFSPAESRVVPGLCLTHSSDHRR